MTEEKEAVPLQELVARQAARQGQPAPKLPRFVANLTPQQVKEKAEAIGRTGTVLIAAWFSFSIGGSVASGVLRRYVVQGRTGLIGDDLWTAQLLLAAPYLVLALVGGVLLRTKSGLRRPEGWCLALAVIYTLSRLRNFQWCGPTDSDVSMVARLADAAGVFAATFFGLGLGTSKPRTEADRFGPGPIEP